MIKPLTSLRFVFAFMVFLSHCSFLKESTSSTWVTIFKNVFAEGYLGVGFFFILSGFILSYNYQERFLNNQYSRKQFYIARLARIYPLHFLTFLIAVPLTYGEFLNNIYKWFIKAFLNLTFLQSFIPKSNIFFAFNGLSWSVCDEMFFYLLFPLILVFINRTKKMLFIIPIVLFPLLTLIIPSEFYHGFFYINPIARIVDFLIGILLFNAYKVVQKKSLHKNFNWLEVFAVVLFLLFFFFHQQVPEVARFSFYYWIPMSVVIFIFSSQKGRLSQILSNKLLIYLGEISFGFYMFHVLVIKYFTIFNRTYFHISNEISIITIILFTSLLISHFSYQYFETPLNKYIREKGKRLHKN